ncbi:hypothetical protein GW590_02690 [Rahnella sp. SAP-1]|uniref:J domain-containing protein n=1 Tax=Rouxiella aceris TaxID=2703884 RepID=A0A848MDQ5_9GAMM|nr:hypothetical protein [Rouxiella aceris]NMP25785.1 hypothetical protein [Rouxiella aceris]
MFSRKENNMAKRSLVKTKAAVASKRLDPQQQFKAHWATIEKLQRQIADQHKQQEALLARFCEEVLPVEHQYLQALYDKTTRLLSFADKKSLGKYDRDALFLWIEEEVDELLNHPFNEHLDLEALRQRYFAVNKMVDTEPTPDDVEDFRQNINELFGSDGGLSDEELLKMMSDPENMFTTMERLFGESRANADTTHSEERSHHGGSHTADSAQQSFNSLLKSQQVNRMYKKLAGVLHPDREAEPAKKAEKHLLMVQLSKAKKTHDIWTIVEMYHQYVDPEFHFSQTEIPAINTLLQQRIATLNAEMAEARDPGTLSGMVWQMFGAKTAKTMDKKLRKHRDNLQLMIDNEIQIRKELRSLSVLKQFLNPMRDELEFERMMKDHW